MTTVIYAKLNAKSKKYSISEKSDATVSITIQDGKMLSPLKTDDFTTQLLHAVQKAEKSTVKKADKPKKVAPVKDAGKVELSSDAVSFIAEVDANTKTINDTKTIRDVTSVKMIHLFKEEMQKVEAIGGFELNSKNRASVVAHAMSEKANEQYTKGVIAAIKYHYTEGHKIPNEFLTIANIKVLKYARMNDLISRNAATKPAEDYKAFLDTTKAICAKHRAEEMAKKTKV